jgi:hypothetical protein
LTEVGGCRFSDGLHHTTRSLLYLALGSVCTRNLLKLVGAGSVTDYIIRLAPCSVFIIKNWRTVPKENEPAIYVVFYAVGSVAALLQLQLCCEYECGHAVQYCK